MDKKKFKSVAISLEVYEKLRKLADDGDRSVSRQIAHMVKTFESRKDKAA